MIHEERSIILQRRTRDTFVSDFDQKVRPTVEANGGEVLCTLSAAIGDPDEDVLQMTRFPDYQAWEQAQAARAANPIGLFQSESVRLLKPVANRPKDVIPAEDLRAFYGHRRFFISPGDLDEFVDCSENGIWPRIHAQGASVLGLWTTVASTSPMEIVLLTGYDGPAHWEETRALQDDAPEGYDQKVWTHSRRKAAQRAQLTIRTWVRLMRRVKTRI